jgi:hypothetical protein
MPISGEGQRPTGGMCAHVIMVLVGGDAGSSEQTCMGRNRQGWTLCNSP